MKTELIKAAEQFADSKERRGTSYWKGLYDGYIAANTNANEPICDEIRINQEGITQVFFGGDVTITQTAGFTFEIRVHNENNTKAVAFAERIGLKWQEIADSCTTERIMDEQKLKDR